MIGNKKSNTLPSRKGRGLINKRNIIVLIIGLSLILFGLIPVVVTPKRETLSSEQVEHNIVEKHKDELTRQGYLFVDYELNPLIKLAIENGRPVQLSIDTSLDPEMALEKAITDRYDFTALYYRVVIDKTEYLFIKEDLGKDIIERVNKYDNTKYELTTVRRLVNSESKPEDLDALVSKKKKAYEEAIARKKAAEQAKKKAQQKQSSGSGTNAGKSAYQEYAHNLVINTYGWSEYDFECLVKLWNRESGWNPNAHNKSSGAHGIPQSLPASKMKSEGADYYTNGYTQIRWGLKYIKGRYGSPSAAWAHSQRKGWY